MLLNSVLAKALLLAAASICIAILLGSSIPSQQGYQTRWMAEYNETCDRYKQGSRKWKRCQRRLGIG